jgi:predicted dehydrogenase
MKVAVIGFGYWGPNLVRNFNSAPGCQVTIVCDGRDERLKVVQKMYPSVQVTKNADDVFKNTEIDAVIIATPVFTHFELAKKALQNSKHVLLEKPMTSTVAEALELEKIASQKNLVLMVDHTFLYTNSIQKIYSLVKEGALGNIKYFDSTRINLGLFQPDINVLWDLAPHDISILDHLIQDKAHSVNATGVSHTNNGIENIAFLTVNYQSGFIAHFNCSWTSPVKIRMLLLGGDKKMLVFNDLEPTEKIKIYDTGYDHKTDEEKRRVLVDYRTGDIFIPKVEHKEALFSMASDFVSSVIKKTKPLSDFASGLNVIKILEASQASIKQGGKEIILS